MAMRLHTKDQAPKEGQKESAEKPLKQVSRFKGCSRDCASILLCMEGNPVISYQCTPLLCPLQWQPSRKGYLRFLTESKQVYDTVESIIAEAPLPECAATSVVSAHLEVLVMMEAILNCRRQSLLNHLVPAHADTGFQNTGLERAAALAQDIAWMQQQYDLTAEPVQEDGPGMAYSRCVYSPGRHLCAHPEAMQSISCLRRWAYSHWQPPSVAMPLPAMALPVLLGRNMQPRGRCAAGLV